MPESNFLHLCTQTVSSVLETMFFTAPMGLTEDDPEDPLQACVAFHGSPSGSLTLRLSRSAAQLLAEGFLGLDKNELNDTQTDLVVCELANMLCGSLVSQLESDQSFDLAAPQLLPPNTTQSPPASPTARQSFELEDGILTVSLHLETA